VRPRFLADESCDQSIVRRLRAAGFDVESVSEQQARSVDGELIARAHGEARVLITEDKDFGWLVYVSHRASAGVILVRYPGQHRASLAGDVLNAIESRVDELAGSFLVLSPGQIRVGRLPGAGDSA
jgi:predicted nuclease of predicted toxin-antitoxin system